MTHHEPLSEADPAIAELIAAESRRQQESINLIASENYASAAVREAAGSVLTNKYAEGYPGKRYYGGCEVVDQIEQLAIDHCKELFGAEHANVQPHSGSQANDAAMAAILQPGDAILSLDFAAGGHLTHGHPLSFSGKRYRVISYDVSRETETIDYDQLREVALAERPALLICGASAYPRTIDFARIRAIADEAGARMLADIAHISGLVATGLHPSPVPYADIVTSTTHKTLRGPRGGVIMCRAELAAAVDRAVFPGAQGGPLLHAIAAKAVAFGEALRPEFREYQERVLASAAAMAETLERRGFRVVSGGTDTHLVLVDITSQRLTGKAAETALERVGITANKNLIPHDARPPADPSGLRIGTPAICTRGMGPREAAEIAHLVADVLAAPEDDETRAHVADKARELAARFPIPA